MHSRRPAVAEQWTALTPQSQGPRHLNFSLGILNPPASPSWPVRSLGHVPLSREVSGFSSEKRIFITRSVVPQMETQIKEDIKLAKVGIVGAKSLFSFK